MARGIGPLKLGITHADAITSLGPPARRARGFARWCLLDGGKLMAHFARGQVDFALTTSRGFDYRRLRVGDARRPSGTTVRRFRRWTLVIGARGRRVTYIAVADRRLGDDRIRKLLRDSR